MQVEEQVSLTFAAAKSTIEDGSRQGRDTELQDICRGATAAALRASTRPFNR
jgi:hypothetical protein